MDRLSAIKLLWRVNAPARNGMTKRKFHASVQYLTANDSSSSSSSDSSSGSDNEKSKKGEKQIKLKQPPRNEAAKQQTVDLLNDLLSKMDKEKSITTSIDLAVPVKKIVKKPKPQSLEEKLVDAAKEVAKSLGGDIQKKEEELLDKIFTAGTGPAASPAVVKKSKKMRKKNKKLKETELQANATAEPSVSESSLSSKIHGSDEEIEIKTEEKHQVTVAAEPRELSLSELLSGMKIDKTPKKILQDQELPITRLTKVKELAGKFQVQARGKNASDFTARAQRELPANLYMGTRFHVFDNKSVSTQALSTTTHLSTWETLEQDELKQMLIHPAENYFEEMIQWTEQGILWKFPIDNEQGMEAEQNVHFSEHVFMERHLLGWCPKKGPIRHFMELVCVGLSKNPYMTVEEKKEHIMWYRDYFGDKQELLKEIHAIDNNILPDATIAVDKQIDA